MKLVCNRSKIFQQVNFQPLRKEKAPGGKLIETLDYKFYPPKYIIFNVA